MLYIVVEINVISNVWLVEKFAAGRVIGNISMIIVRGNSVIKYCLILNRFIYWVVNLWLFNNNEKLISLLVIIIMIE